MRSTNISSPKRATLNPIDSIPDRRQRRSADIRERLFRAALQLFAEKGFAETTVGDITEAADVGKGTFFNYFPSKDHILLAFGEMQVAKLQDAVDTARNTNEPMPQFLRSLGVRMTQEPTRNPAIIRALLQAYLSTTPVRAAMIEMQNRVHALHTQMIQLGQDRGEISNQLPAADIAYVFRQTIFGTLLIWSLYGDATLHARIESAFNVLWSGLAPRALASATTLSDVACSPGPQSGPEGSDPAPAKTPPASTRAKTATHHPAKPGEKS